MTAGRSRSRRDAAHDGRPIAATSRGILRHARPRHGGMPQRKTGDDPDPRSIPEAGVARPGDAATTAGSGRRRRRASTTPSAMKRLLLDEAIRHGTSGTSALRSTGGCPSRSGSHLRSATVVGGSLGPAFAPAHSRSAIGAKEIGPAAAVSDAAGRAEEGLGFRTYSPPPPPAAMLARIWAASAGSTRPKELAHELRT